jgi:hypothetical protein
MIASAAALAIMTASPPAAADPPAAAAPPATETPEAASPPDAGTHEESHAKLGLIIGGVATFGISYMLAALVVMTNPGENRDTDMGSSGGPKASLIIPFAGPFLQMSSTEVSGFGNVLYATNGLAQIAGLAMTVVGLASRTKVVVPDKAAQIRVAPLRLGQAGTGVGLSGTF